MQPFSHFGFPNNQTLTVVLLIQHGMHFQPPSALSIPPCSIRCTHAIFAEYNYHNCDMSIPSHMINGGNADTLGEANLLRSDKKKNSAERSADKENDVSVNQGDKQRDALATDYGKACPDFHDFDDFTDGCYDAGGFADPAEGIVHGGNCDAGNINDSDVESGHSKGIDGKSHDDGDPEDSDEQLSKTKELLEEARKTTFATSNGSLHIGGSADTKYRPKRPASAAESSSDAGKAAQAMQGFTTAYVEQCAQDRAAMQQDAAAARALLKAELAQQKEIAETCRQM
uniref:Uncharacterized protein n=1 Tax=Chrysotila carterae TaxID=13221 RepID=A0A7S4F0C5_CHRCT